MHTAQERQQAADGGLEQLKVLLVEDDLIDSVTFQRAARARFLPYQITPVETLAAAREALASSNFDVAVVDHQLADGSGLELLSSTKRLPLIILTCAGDEELARSALRHGVYDYVVKHTDGRHFEALPAAVQGAVAARRAEVSNDRSVAEIERSDRELKNFAKLMTRVLTAPLESARTLASGLRTQESIQADPVAVTVVGAIDQGLRRANALLGDLGSYTQLSKEAETQEEINVAEVVQQLLSSNQDRLSEIKATVETRNLATLIARPRQLTAALDALLDNAIVHGGYAPEILIEQVSSGRGTSLFVQDSGPGVNEMDRLRVFEIFRKADTSGPGNGIGLALVRRVAEIHDGRAECSQVERGGARFSIRLP